MRKFYSFMNCPHKFDSEHKAMDAASYKSSMRKLLPLQTPFCCYIAINKQYGPLLILAGKTINWYRTNGFWTNPRGRCSDKLLWTQNKLSPYQAVERFHLRREIKVAISSDVCDRFALQLINQKEISSGMDENKQCGFIAHDIDFVFVAALTVVDNLIEIFTIWLNNFGYQRFSSQNLSHLLKLLQHEQPSSFSSCVFAPLKCFVQKTAIPFNNRKPDQKVSTQLHSLKLQFEWKKY